MEGKGGGEKLHIYANPTDSGALKEKFLKQLDAVETNRTSCFSWGPTEVGQKY